MSKPIRSLSDLSEFLDSELAWRKSELSQFKLALSGSDDRRRAFLRAGIALLYAHWEGYVKAAARGYLDFVSRQGLKYSDLPDHFLAIASRRILSPATGARRIGLHIEAAKFFRTGLGSPSRLDADSISTESNLSHAVLCEILLTLGLDPSPYATKEKFIDAELLRRRNRVAHGDYLDVDDFDWTRMRDEVVRMLDAICTEILNAASNGQYRII